MKFSVPSNVPFYPFPIVHLTIYAFGDPFCSKYFIFKHFTSDISSIAGSTDNDSESSGVTDDESYDDYVGCNPEENEEDGGPGDNSSGDDGAGDEVSLQG